MPRPPRAEKSVRLELHLSESVHARLTLLLYSDAEQRVPHGEWSRFFESLARESLDRLARATPPTTGGLNAHQPHR